MILLGGLCLQSEMLKLYLSASNTKQIQDLECSFIKRYGRELWIPMILPQNPPTETSLRPTETTLRGPRHTDSDIEDVLEPYNSQRTNPNGEQVQEPVSVHMCYRCQVNI